MAVESLSWKGLPTRRPRLSTSKSTVQIVVMGEHEIAKAMLKETGDVASIEP
jgi:hypothetical protein